jgi:hypothetical protein
MQTTNFKTVLLRYTILTLVYTCTFSLDGSYTEPTQISISDCSVTPLINLNSENILFFFSDGNVRVIFKTDFYMIFLYVTLTVTNANVYLLRKHSTDKV